MAGRCIKEVMALFWKFPSPASVPIVPHESTYLGRRRVWWPGALQPHVGHEGISTLVRCPISVPIQPHWPSRHWV